MGAAAPVQPAVRQPQPQPHTSQTVPLGEFDAVVLLQMGGPARLSDIRPFLARLFSDPDIIRLPPRIARGQPVFAHTMAMLRAPLVRPRYRAMGDGSPLNRITNTQASRLAERLNVDVHVAMRYTAPTAEDVCRRLKGASRVLVVPLYPHWSHTTTGSSLGDLARAMSAAEVSAETRVVTSWGQNEQYTRLVAETCEESLQCARAEIRGDVHLVLSAHSLPRHYIEQGDPYQDQVDRSFQLVKRLVGPSFASVRLGYQSRVGPVDWIGPETDEVLEQLAAEGAQAVHLAPFGFVSDHIETLYDMDRKYRKQTRRLGIPHYHRVPSFNDDPRFTTVLEDLCRDAPNEPVQEVIPCEA